ncbi:hypothetical protein [Pararhizobium mangrovi]|uniref:DUF4407 domain-containing protein n=1 Tax=Pararhizobium mangrovi TaxID=2590452 RepID=A0A506U0L6_9HYPH|nr:hypothetical protein [Pararhizobium mangrovi]TPW26139.1 hypothetical protein FJU11_16065 [Pararhizobium mangrovi]
MRDATLSRRLEGHVRSLETMTRFVLATLALASGVYTYLGVRSLLDGSATGVFFAAIMYAGAVSVGIYGFWTYLMRFLPEMRSFSSRIGLVAVMVLGCAMIVAMSSWLNAAALAGSAAVEQHLAETLEGYTSDLDQAHDNALGSLSLLPDIQRAEARFSRLADEERSSGALTGTSGSGSVVQLLSQMSAQMAELEQTIGGSRKTVSQLFEKGQAKLAEMRGLVSGSGPVQPRSDTFAKRAVELSGIISSLQQTSAAPSLARAAQDLAAGFIAPVADGSDADLAGRQDAVMKTVRQSVAAQSTALAQAADEIMQQPKVAERRYVPLSSAEAVLRYATSFLPSWAGAISIDLLPAVLVLILSVVYATIREGEDEMSDAERMSAADLLRALDINERFRQRSHGIGEPEPETEPVEETGTERREDDAASSGRDHGPNVTALARSEPKRPD